MPTLPSLLMQQIAVSEKDSRYSLSHQGCRMFSDLDFHCRIVQQIAVGWFLDNACEQICTGCDDQPQRECITFVSWFPERYFCLQQYVTLTRITLYHAAVQSSLAGRLVAHESASSIASYDAAQASGISSTHIVGIFIEHTDLGEIPEIATQQNQSSINRQMYIMHSTLLLLYSDRWKGHTIKFLFAREIV